MSYGESIEMEGNYIQMLQIGNVEYLPTDGFQLSGQVRPKQQTEWSQHACCLVLFAQ